MCSEVQVPRDALVIRFRPIEPAAVRERAKREYRRSGAYRSSVFAAAAEQGEDPHTLRVRLLRAGQLSGIDPERNPKYYVCSTAAELYDRGFTFHKDGVPGELPEHYSVDLGSDLAVGDVELFLEAFTSAEEWP